MGRQDNQWKLLGGADEKPDYSINVPPSWSREQIYEQLSSFQLTDSQRETSRMKGTLSRLLKEKHPIHQYVGNLSTPIIKKLYGQLCPSGKQRLRQRRETAVITFIFKHHAEAPLTAVQKLVVSLQDIAGNLNPQK